MVREDLSEERIGLGGTVSELVRERTPASARRRVLAIVDEREVTVVALDTGEVLSAHRIEPGKSYWRDTRRDPGRWRGSPVTG